MELILRREDLREECRMHGASRIKFESLNDEAQAAVKLIGKGMFREHDDSNYNVVYPPKG